MALLPRQSNAAQQETKMTAPGAGVHGKMSLAQEIPPRAPLVNISQNHSPQQGPTSPKKTAANLAALEKNVPHETSPAISGTILPAPRKIKLPDGSKIDAGIYVPVFAQMMVDYFNNAEKFRTVYETASWKNGEVREIEKQVPNAPPSPREFAHSIGITHRKLKVWAKKYPEFKDAYEECQEIYKDFLIENGLLGHYPAQFATFVAKNETDMKDKNINENINFNVNDFLNKLESGKITGDEDEDVE